LKQDPELVFRILEHRALIASKDQHNRNVKKMKPAMVAIWLEMLRAAGTEEQEQENG